MTQPARPEPILKPSVREALGIDIPTIEICDVGAMAEGADRYAGLVAQGLANVNGFEPNPVEFAKLQQQDRPRRRYFPYFMGSGEPATFHVAQYPGCSSLYEPDPDVIDLFTSIGATLPGGNFAVTCTRQVQTQRLDDVPGLPKIDCLKLDVQGAELDVLRGAASTLAHVSVIEVEVEFVPLYKHQPLFGDIQVFLRDHHFVLHKFLDFAGRVFRPLHISNNPVASMSQVLWADAVFVRDFAHLDAYSADQLLKAAVILHEVYYSHDLAYHLLEAYDKRCGAGLAARFLQGLPALPELPLAYLTQKNWV